MDWTFLQTWLATTNLGLFILLLFLAMCLSAAVGTLLRRAQQRGADADAASEGQRGYIVSAVLGLLALLMGFTFSLAVDRFEARRHLVLEEANAIGTAYLRAQLLSEPHRTRMSDILRRYTENRIELARAGPWHSSAFLAKNDALTTDMWSATSAAFPTIQGLDFSSTYLDSVNAVIDLGSARKAARTARVPAEVFAVLGVYLITTAGVLGYVLRGAGGKAAGTFLLALLALSLALIVDIDRPTLGGIVESQGPMEELRNSFATPPSVFDRWRADGGRIAPGPVVAPAPPP